MKETIKNERKQAEQIPKKRGGITGNKNPMLHDSISRIFNWYKGGITFESQIVRQCTSKNFQSNGLPIKIFQL